jgi:nicotinate-nucleotide--dimethylbenzimidazole phosphoribosyltransferase
MAQNPYLAVHEIDALLQTLMRIASDPHTSASVLDSFISAVPAPQASALLFKILWGVGARARSEAADEAAAADMTAESPAASARFAEAAPAVAAAAAAAVVAPAAAPARPAWAAAAAAVAAGAGGALEAAARSEASDSETEMAAAAPLEPAPPAAARPTRAPARAAAAEGAAAAAVEEKAAVKKVEGVVVPWKEAAAAVPNVYGEKGRGAWAGKRVFSGP